MKTYSWFALAVLLGVGSFAQAQRPYGYGPGSYGVAPRENPATEAAAVLREGVDKLLAFLGQEEKPNKLQVAAFLDKDIAPYFDFDFMAKWVAGRGYSAMSEEQRSALAAKLEARFLATMASQLSRYEGQKVRYLRPRPGARGSVNVRVAILRPGSYPSKLNFRMYRSADGWKVYDVVANGRSASASYRQQLRQSSAPPQPGSSRR